MTDKVAILLERIRMVRRMREFEEQRQAERRVAQQKLADAHKRLFPCHRYMPGEGIIGEPFELLLTDDE